MNLERNEFGSGEPCFVMLHGNSLDSTIFNPLVTELRVKYKIITFSLPGHGNSEKPNTYNIKDLSCTIINAVNKETGKKYILAHSLSGHLILQGLPGLKDAAGIICVGTPPLSKTEDTATAFTWLGKLMNNAKWSSDEENNIIEGLTKDGYQLIREALLKSDAGFRKAITTSNFLHGFTNEIANLNKTKLPVSLIFSTDDGFIELPYCKHLSTVIKKPNVKINFIDFGGHLPFYNFPIDFCRIIEDIITV